MLLRKPYLMHTEIEKIEKEFSDLWITRINAGAREHGLSYSELISKLKSNNISINRKVLADLAMNDPKKFEQIIKSLK